jgi:hypothetical protein
MGLKEGGIHGDAYTLRVCPPHVFVLCSLVHTRPLCSSSPRPRRTWCPQSLRQPPRPTTVYVHRLHLCSSCLTINPGYCALRACAVSSSLHRVAIPLCAVFDYHQSQFGGRERGEGTHIRIQRVSSACMNKNSFTSLSAESTLHRSAVDIHHARSPPRPYSLLSRNGAAQVHRHRLSPISSSYPCSSHPSRIPCPPAPSHPTQSCRATPPCAPSPSHSHHLLPISYLSFLAARRYASDAELIVG